MLPTFPHTIRQTSSRDRIAQRTETRLRSFWILRKWKTSFHLESMAFSRRESNFTAIRCLWNYLMPAAEPMKAAAEASTHEPRLPSGSCYKIVMIEIGNSQKAARKRNNCIEACTKEINRAMVKFMYFSLQPRLSLIKQFSFFSRSDFCFARCLIVSLVDAYETVSLSIWNNFQR